MSGLLGTLNKKDFVERMDSIQEKINKTTSNQIGMKEKLKKLTDINNKLSDSYNVSLHVIVDVSKLMNQYMKFFNQIDENLRKLDSNATLISAEDVQYINKLTSMNINDMVNKFKQELNGIIEVYQKNNMKTNKLLEYDRLLDSINNEAVQITKQGGKKLTKKISKKCTKCQS
jgi:hypothetical protein